MRYVFYVLTALILFSAGLVVGNLYLPDRSSARSAAVAVPGLPEEEPIFQQLNRPLAEKNLDTLNQALSSCPVVIEEEKDRLVNQIKLLFSMQEFELKKAQLELEMAKNIDTNRPTTQFTQATSQYNDSLKAVTKMAQELFPPQPKEEPQEADVQTNNSTVASAPSTETKVSTTSATK